MKKFIIFLPILMSLNFCNKAKEVIVPEEPETQLETFDYNFGVFLGATGEDTDTIRNSKFHTVILDIDEFTNSELNQIRNKGKNIYGYLSVGSLETYRDYYEEYEEYTFMDYDNWPDERWVDVSQEAWQEHIRNEASRLYHSKDIKGVFVDNLDVYYIASEEFGGGEAFAENIYIGCLNILETLINTFDDIFINSGSTLLERMDEENNSLLNNISCYVQECVYSNILDYDNDIFGRQDEETQSYYKSVIEMMSEYSQILLLEYTTDKDVISDIKEYAKKNGYHYYISSDVNLSAKKAY